MTLIVSLLEYRAVHTVLFAAKTYRRELASVKW